MDGSKERQGDFVFTANEPGEYRFCFNNEMSTFADKMVDFEIAVRPPLTHPLYFLLPFEKKILTNTNHPLSKTGRKRTKSPTPLQARNLPRTNNRTRRIHPQTLRPALHDKPQPEIFPNEGKQKFQYGEEYGEENIQF